MRFSTTLAALTAAFFPLATLAVPTGNSASTPAVAPEAGNKFSDHYIVVLKEEIDEDTFISHQQWVTKTHKNRLARRDDSTLTGLKSKYVFGKFKGYSGSFDASTIDDIRLSPEVSKINQIIWMSGD